GTEGTGMRRLLEPQAEPPADRVGLVRLEAEPTQLPAELVFRQRVSPAGLGPLGVGLVEVVEVALHLPPAPAGPPGLAPVLDELRDEVHLLAVGPGRGEHGLGRVEALGLPLPATPDQDREDALGLGPQLVLEALVLRQAERRGGLFGLVDESHVERDE